MIMISYIGGGSECYEKRLSIPCLNELKVINPIFGNLNLIFHLCHPDQPPHPPPKNIKYGGFSQKLFCKKKKRKLFKAMQMTQLVMFHFFFIYYQVGFDTLLCLMNKTSILILHFIIYLDYCW